MVAEATIELGCSPCCPQFPGSSISCRPKLKVKAMNMPPSTCEPHSLKVRRALLELGPAFRDGSVDLLDDRLELEEEGA